MGVSCSRREEAMNRQSYVLLELKSMISYGLYHVLYCCVAPEGMLCEAVAVLGIFCAKKRVALNT